MNNVLRRQKKSNELNEKYNLITWMLCFEI